MKEKVTAFFSNSTWIKFIGNKYFLVTLFFIIWMLFLDNYSYLDHRILNQDIEELEDNKAYYQEEIKKDKEQIKKLKNPIEIEKYAREKYFMKRENEDIYIIEFEGDTLDKIQ
ncbi:FtsB family cell division protein [Flavobacterium luminosum]|uniref:Septum formation initiator family protein n=1 Tax=Flavobacterium luminosum TaxID=2949086 RepID=A0ABT0TNB2_9FLAO|nr:septum formation initiator family protein [Flavobacterium sp. HXWNR70]MCL9808992.1 septum formation initiator family protein [Flavobacterium sp. HXWNR70]